jgi:hypothetical protein
MSSSVEWDMTEDAAGHGMLVAAVTRCRCWRDGQRFADEAKGQFATGFEAVVEYDAALARIEKSCSWCQYARFTRT